MRRTAVLSGAAALVLAAAVVAAYAGSHDRAPKPHVVTPADAVRPQEGHDYRVVTTLRGDDALGASGLTRSGEVVVYTGPLVHGTGGEFHVTLLDPTSGRRTRLPDGLGRVLDATDRRVAFYRYIPGSRGHLELARLDRSSGQVRHFLLPPVRGRIYHVLGLDGSLVWFATAPDAENAQAEDVYSVRFGRPGTLEHHGRRSRPTYADDTLSWVVSSLDGPDVIATQQLSDGDVTRVALPEDCRVRPSSSDLRSNGTQLVVNASCGHRVDGAGAASEQRSMPTFVLDRDGGGVTELLVVPDEGAVGLSERTVSFYWYSYDLTSDTLYDVSDRSTLGGLPPTTGPGRHPLALWPQGSDGSQHHPTRVLVVRLR